MDYGYMPSHAAPADIPEDFKANAGEPLADGVKVASEEEVIEAMRTVYDPEIPVNIRSWIDSQIRDFRHWCR